MIANEIKMIKELLVSEIKFTTCFLYVFVTAKLFSVQLLFNAVCNIERVTPPPRG